MIDFNNSENQIIFKLYQGEIKAKIEKTINFILWKSAYFDLKKLP